MGGAGLLSLKSAAAASRKPHANITKESRRVTFGRELGRGQGEIEGELGALAEAAFDVDGDAVELQDAARDGETEAGAFDIVGPVAFDPVKAFEYSGQVCLGNAHTGVGDLGREGLAVRGEGDVHPATGRRVLDRIFNQVLEDAFDKADVARHVRRIVWNGGIENQRFLFRST